jgi:putative copper export protein
MMRAGGGVGARVAVGLAAGIPVLLLVLATLGALVEVTDVGLPVVPWSTLWSLPLDRWARDIAAALTLGFLVIGALLLGRPEPRLLRVASLWAVVWLAALLAQIPLTVSELLGRPLTESLDLGIMRSLLTQTQLGQALLAQIALVGMAALLGWAVLGRVTGWFVIACAVSAACLPALTGHSGLHGGHTAATVSLAVHLVGIGVWVGGLAAVLLYAARRPPDATVALRRFSTVALICVIAVGESGLLNASLRVDGIASLITTPYGTLIIAKATIFAALVVLGWRWRRRVLPRFDSVPGSGVLVRIAAFEFALMGVALGVSVALSRTAPPAGAIAGDRITAGALALLAVAVPLVLVWAGACPSVLRRITAAYPEPFAVLTLVSAVGCAALVRSGALSIGATAAAAALLLVGCGWVFAVGAAGERGLPAIVLAMIGWPVIAWWVTRSDSVETVWQVVLALAVAEVCLLMLLLVRRSRLRKVDPLLRTQEAEALPSAAGVR